MGGLALLQSKKVKKSPGGFQFRVILTKLKGVNFNGLMFVKKNKIIIILNK